MFAIRMTSTVSCRWLLWVYLANNRSQELPNSLTSFCVDNLDFQAWRKFNGKLGGDFLIFSDLQRLRRTPPDKFDIP